MLVERSLWKFFRHSPTFLRVFGKGGRIRITVCLFFLSRHPPHYFPSDCSCDHELRGSCVLDKLGNDGLIISGDLGCKTSRSKWLYDGAQHIVLVESGWRALFSLKNIKNFKNHFFSENYALGFTWLVRISMIQFHFEITYMEAIWVSFSPWHKQYLIIN